MNRETNTCFFLHTHNKSIPLYKRCTIKLLFLAIQKRLCIVCIGAFTFSFRNICLIRSHEQHFESIFNPRCVDDTNQAINERHLLMGIVNSNYNNSTCLSHFMCVPSHIVCMRHSIAIQHVTRSNPTNIR